MAYAPDHQETPASPAETFMLPGTLHSQARDQHTEKALPYFRCDDKAGHRAPCHLQVSAPAVQLLRHHGNVTPAVRSLVDAILGGLAAGQVSNAQATRVSWRALMCVAGVR